MSLTIVNEVLPLTVDVAGVVRVGGTRVTLDTVVAAFLCQVNMMPFRAKREIPEA